MATTVTSGRETVTKKAAGAEARRPAGNGRGRPGPNGGGPNDGGGGPAGGWSPRRYRVGMMVGIASILMMFTALTSAYIVRAGLANDWRPLPVPLFIWVSTALILASSVTFGAAKKALGKGAARLYRRWLTATLALGLAFLGAQLLAWRELVAQGVYLATNPHSSFFYVLTALHGLHLAGGIVALSYLLARARWASIRMAAEELKQRTLAEVVGIYWHFMDGLWVFLFLLLFLWR